MNVDKLWLLPYLMYFPLEKMQLIKLVQVQGLHTHWHSFFKYPLSQ